MDYEYNYEAGHLPDRYYYQFVNKPYQAYDRQRKKSKGKNHDTTFFERFIFDFIQSAGSAILQQSIDELLDAFNQGK